MKKRFLNFALFMCILMMCITFNCSFVFASNTIDEMLIPESLLSNFEEKDEIEVLSAEIVDMANCFEGDGFYAEISDVDFSKAYCVFVEADILTEIPQKRSELEKLLDSAHKVWNIPVYANGKVVLVQVSKGVELSEIEQDEFSEEELERIRENAGKWHTVSSTMYEEGQLPVQRLGGILSANSINVDECKCVLIGGESGIRTLIAVMIENDTVSGAISLERTVTYVSNEQTKNRNALKTKTFNLGDEESENNVKLQQNQIYLLEEFAKVASQELEDNTQGDGMRGPSSNGGEQSNLSKYYIIGGMILGLAILIGVFSRRYLRSKR